MEIKLYNITVRELIKDYNDNGEGGVVGYGGKLDIRPIYQREFHYGTTNNGKKRDAVIYTIMKGFPLNTMYWHENDGGTYEVIDGQQRTISICEYVIGKFSLKINGRVTSFYNLEIDEKNTILNYELQVYFCKGTDKEKLDWFETVNISGEKLTKQELRNAVYSGVWVSEAKRYFSKTGCVAYSLANKYMKGTPIKQDYLEAVINWASGGMIEDFMSEHQHKTNANDLWLYFKEIIDWVKTTFPKYRKAMGGLAWGEFYSEFKDKALDPAQLEEEISKLILDDDVTAKPKEIYKYVLTREEKLLNIRAFSENQKARAYEKQEGICPICGEHFNREEMEADHIIPWCDGGETTKDNCQMLCKKDNRTKGGR